MGCALAHWGLAMSDLAHLTSDHSRFRGDILGQGARQGKCEPGDGQDSCTMTDLDWQIQISVVGQLGAAVQRGLLSTTAIPKGL